MPGLFDSIIHASLWGGGFTVMFLMVNKLLKNKLPASWHYYIWLAVLLRLLVPAFITVNVEPSLTALPQHLVNIEAAGDFAPPPIHKDMAFSETDGMYPIDNPPVPGKIQNDVLRLNNLWIIWLTVAVLIFGFNSLSYLLFIRRLKAKNTAVCGETLRGFEGILRERGVLKRISLYKNPKAQTPFVIGLLNPAIILPDKEYSSLQLRYIFSHELNHITGHDIAVKWFFEIAKAIHWFNPFVYIASRNASFYCEALCDDAVLRNLDENDRKEYGLTIIEVVGQAVGLKPQMCISMSNRADLKERVQNILSGGQRKGSIVLAASLAIAVPALCAFSSIRYKEAATGMPAASVEPGLAETGSAEQFSVPIKKTTNLLIGGIDAAGLADAIAVVSLNTETNQISLLSVPRDTYLKPSEDTVSRAKEQGFYFPDEMKLNQLTAYTGGSMEYLQSEISNYLGISIDYYIKMNMSAFEEIVDAVGGVDIDIPADYIYTDPYQDLKIDLKAGVQHLNGERALQYIRYRAGYPNADLDRINVQQQFLKELYRKAVHGDNILERASSIMTILVGGTETNMTIPDLTPYLLCIAKLNANSLQTFIPSAEAGQFSSGFCLFLNRDELEGVVAGNFR